MRKSDHKYDQIPAVCEQNINYCWSDHEQQLFNCYWRDFEQMTFNRYWASPEQSHSIRR